MSGKWQAVLRSDSLGLMHAWKLETEDSNDLSPNYTNHLPRREARDQSLQSCPVYTVCQGPSLRYRT